jgi:amino acid adenylation domain-containing protein
MSSATASYEDLQHCPPPHLPWELYQRWQGYGDKTAICTANGTLVSFLQLVQGTERKYWGLSSYNLPTRSTIAIGGPMSADMVMTILACWLHGFIITLIDGNQPRARQEALLRLAAPQLAVNCPLYAAFPSVLDRTYDEIQSSRHPISTEVMIEAAYIVFTSGSTGTPKAVVGSHKGLAHFFIWQIDEFGITNSDRFAQLTAVGFDVIFRSVFTPLYAGAALFLCPYGIEQPRPTLDWLYRERITCMHLVPAIMKLWLTSCPNARLLDSLRYVFSAGEKLRGSLLRAIRQQWNPTASIVNLYGTTETSLAKCYHRCLDADEECDVVPVGRSIPGSEVWVMDEEGLRCGTGDEGEVVIRTPYRSLGYLNALQIQCERSDATCGIGDAKSPDCINPPFRPTPDSECSDDLLYFTGDLGYLDADGLLHLHGRKDDQVKINGIRIELGEIEAFLVNLPYVEQATVCLQQGPSLVAHLVVGQSMNVEKVNTALRDHFPPSMCPAVVVHATLPLNANGKLDRQLLSMDQRQHTKCLSSPETKMEKLIASVWQEHLQIRQVGRHDDFFTLGGNSISAIAMGSELTRHTGKLVPVKVLFQMSKLSDFAWFMEKQATLEESNGPDLQHDAKNKCAPFGLTDVQRAYLIGRDSSFELGGVSTHNYLEEFWPSLDVHRLSQCIDQLVKRHESLRTVYSLQGSQRVLEAAPSVQIAVQDLCHLSSQQRQEAFLQWRDELEQQIFDVHKFPLFELRVSKQADGFTLHFSYDVLMMDALSRRIFLRELRSLYHEPQLVLPELGIAFRDYQLAHEALRKTKRFKQDREYWLKRIPNMPLGPALALACRPDAVSAPRFGRRSFRLTNSTWESLKQLTQRQQISTVIPFLELYGRVLANWSTNEDFLINLTLFQRENFHPDVNKLIGDFTVLSLFEYRRQFEKPASQSLRDTHTRLWDNLAHTLFSGIQVQSELAKQNQVSGHKAISPVVLTSMLNLPSACHEFLSDGQRRSTYTRTQTSQVWLDNNIYETDYGVVVEWDYVMQLFDEQQIDDMLSAYQHSLECLAAGDQDIPIRIPLPVAHRDLLQKYNDTACVDVIPTASIHEMVVKAAAVSPNAPAVIAPHGVVLSYDNLLQQAHNLCHVLQATGVNSSDRIMLYVEKGPQLVTAILGVLMAGAVFVPVNLKWPSSRLRSIIRQADIFHIVVSKSRKDFLQSEISLDSTINDQIQYYHPNIDPFSCSANRTPTNTVNVPLEHPAYTIFTSGSTGQPKGVCISHGSVLNTILDINKRLAVSPGDRTLCLSNVSFDLAIYDIIGPLVAGAAVVMPVEDVLDHPHSVAQLMNDAAVSIYNSTPAVMSLLLHAGSLDLYPRLRYVLLSGDFVPPSLPDQITTSFSKAEILILGGATEASIWSIVFQYKPSGIQGKCFPYGRPLSNQQIWILDPNQQMCPIDVPGEIYISGAGVASGYEGDLEKTKAQFGTWDDGRRYYQTGDIGIMRRDGNVYILGRKDGQVKINGFRIELGEIDSVLQSHPDVQTSLSRVHIAESGPSQSLISYVVPRIFDRLSFKLERRGIRKCRETQAHIALQPNTPKRITEDVAERLRLRRSYRHFDRLSFRDVFRRLHPLLSNTTWPTSRPSFISDQMTKIDLLAASLYNIRSFDHEIEGLGRHLYPSAGGLYPVRVYLTLGKSWVGQQAQFYYHPDRHALIPTNLEMDDISDEKAYIQFKTCVPAIEPAYHQNAIRYSEVEAGCMLAIIENDCALKTIDVMLPLRQFPDEPDELTLASFALSHAHITAPRPKHSVGRLPIHSLLLYRDSSSWQVFNFTGSEFEHRGTKSTSHKFGCDAYVDGVVEEAAALLLLPDMSGIHHGYILQCLAEYLISASWGSCILGELKFDSLPPLSGAHQSRYFGALAIGPLSSGSETREQSSSSSHTGFATPLQDKLQGYLEERLPDYMIPKQIVLLPALPLTPNGKIDTKALPPLPNSSDLVTPGRQPRNQYELSLQTLWKQILTHDHSMSIDDDFFVYGGSSLDAILLAANIGQYFARAVPTAFVYKNRTIERQAQAVMKFILQPTLDRVKLVEKADGNELLVLFSPSDSGAEAYHALAQRLSIRFTVVGINNLFINHPERVEDDWAVSLGFYIEQVAHILRDEPNRRVRLGGWSVGGNVAVAVAEGLAGFYSQIHPQIILLDSFREYRFAHDTERENTIDTWSPYHPENVMFRHFAIAGYTRQWYYRYLDRLADHLGAMVMNSCNSEILLMKCSEAIANFPVEEANNGWDKLAKEIIIRPVEAHHYNLLTKENAVELIASILLAL